MKFPPISGDSASFNITRLQCVLHDTLRQSFLLPEPIIVSASGRGSNFLPLKSVLLIRLYQFLERMARSLKSPSMGLGTLALWIRRIINLIVALKGSSSQRKTLDALPLSLPVMPIAQFISFLTQNYFSVFINNNYF